MKGIRQIALLLLFWRWLLFPFQIYMHTCVQENAGSAEYDMDCLLRSEVKLCHCFLESRLRCLRITVFITIVRLNIHENVAETDFDSKAAKATRTFYQALHIQEWNSYDQLWVFPQNLKKMVSSSMMCLIDLFSLQANLNKTDRGHWRKSEFKVNITAGFLFFPHKGQKFAVIKLNKSRRISSVSITSLVPLALQHKILFLQNFCLLTLCKLLLLFGL